MNAHAMSVHTRLRAAVAIQWRARPVSRQLGSGISRVFGHRDGGVAGTAARSPVLVPATLGAA
jgi:hypothetical protein